MTGDTGKITEEGSLIIYGRKKELIKTSYGKCIYSGKIESMLHELPAVSEALLVGESKPYCTALIWIDKKRFNQSTFMTIDNGVEKMNQRLSNPEKIKRWAIIANDLTIEKGDITPNLKLKRIIALQKNEKTIEALYSGEKLAAEVHVGGVEKPGE
jgi:long-chain acyl-CoA synthetase